MATNSELGFKLTFEGEEAKRMMDVVTASLNNFSNSLIKASTAAKNQMQRIEKNTGQSVKHLKKLGAELRTISTYLTTYLAYRGITTFNELNNEVVEYNKWIHQAATLTDDMGGYFQLLNRDVGNLASTLGISLPDAAKAAYQAISAGVNPRGAVRFLQETGEAAIAGAADLESTTRLISSLLNTYQLDLSKVRDVSDMLFVAIQKGIVTMPELAQELGTVAPIAKQAGVSLDDLLVTLAGLTKSGIRAPIAATAIRSALLQLIKPNKELGETLEQLRRDFEGFDRLPLVRKFELIAASVGYSTEAVAKLFPNVRGLNAVMATINKNATMFTDILTAMRNRAGVTAVAVAEMRESWDFMFRQMKSEFFNILKEMSEEYLPVVIQGLQDMLDVLRQLKEEGRLGEMAELIKGIAGDVLKLATVLSKLAAFNPILSRWVLYLIAFRKSLYATIAGLTEVPGLVVAANTKWQELSHTINRIVVVTGSWTGVLAYGLRILSKYKSIGLKFAGTAVAATAAYMSVKHLVKTIDSVATSNMKTALDEMADPMYEASVNMDKAREAYQRLLALKQQGKSVNEAELEAAREEYEKAQRIYQVYKARYDRELAARRKVREEAERSLRLEQRRLRIIQQIGDYTMQNKRYRQAITTAEADRKKLVEQRLQIEKLINDMTKRREELRKRLQQAERRYNDGMFNLRVKLYRKQLEQRKKVISGELKARLYAIKKAEDAEKAAAERVRRSREDFRWESIREFKKDIKERLKHEAARAKVMAKLEKQIRAKMARGAKLKPHEEVFKKMIIDPMDALKKAQANKRKVLKENPVEHLRAQLKKVEDQFAKLQAAIEQRDIARQKADLSRQKGAIENMRQLIDKLKLDTGKQTDLLGQINATIKNINTQIAAYNKQLQQNISALQSLAGYLP